MSSYLFSAIFLLLRIYRLDYNLNLKCFLQFREKRRKMLKYWKDISLSLVCCKVNSRVAETVCEMFQKNWAWPWIRVWRFASLNALSFFRKKEISCFYDVYLWGFILKINSFRIYFYLSNIGWWTKKNR